MVAMELGRNDVQVIRRYDEWTKEPAVMDGLFDEMMTSVLKAYYDTSALKTLVPDK